MQANLIHPVPLTIQRKDNASTVFDSISREPVRQVWRTGEGPGLSAEVTLEGQVHWSDGKVKFPVVHPAGIEEQWKGYVLVSLAELESLGLASEDADGVLTISVSRGDRISRIGRRSCNLYVAWFRDLAHYPDIGGAGLLEIDFADRLGE